MKYLIYDELQYELIYCNKNNDETTVDIAKAIPGFFVGNFNPDNYEAIEKRITNNGYVRNNLFVIDDLNDGLNGHTYIWQVCGKASDMNGIIIPNLYKVRKIGIIV